MIAATTATAAEPVLAARGVRKVYSLRAGLLTQLIASRSDTVTAVDGVSVDLRRGEILALVGESGCGKSTLGRLLAGLESPTEGDVSYRGQPVAVLRGGAAKQFRRDVQMIFQNPYESLDPRMTIGATVTEPLQIHGLASSLTHRGSVLDALAEVGLTPPESFVDRLPHELSGGQRQRVAIARAMVLHPQVLIADEPVSMLDASIRSGVMNLMHDLRQAKGVSYLFITHDLAVARYMGDRIAVMYLGKVVEEGPIDPVLAGPAHPYTRFLLAAVPRIEAQAQRARVRLTGEAAETKQIPPGCRFHPRCPLAQAICRSDLPPLVAVGPDRTAACHFAREVLSMGNGPLPAAATKDSALEGSQPVC